MAVVSVRATVRFGGLSPGDVVLVETTDPEIASYLRAGFLVIVLDGGDDPDLPVDGVVRDVLD